MGAWIEIALKVPKPYLNQVAPLVGAWIEIVITTPLLEYGGVAPLVGAWIEILGSSTSTKQVTKSHPSWVRGLKCHINLVPRQLFLCRTPRGCVD